MEDCRIGSYKHKDKLGRQSCQYCDRSGESCSGPAYNECLSCADGQIIVEGECVKGCGPQ